MPSDYQMLQAICRESFGAFAQKAFTIIEPGTDFEFNWHLDCIAEHLQAQFNGDEELRKLVINIPPRCLKSVMVAQLYPAWVMGKEPHHQFIGVSYAHSLAERNVVKCRQIMRDEWYLDTFKETILSNDQNQKDYFTTTKSGAYKGTGLGGSVTGYGCLDGDVLVYTDSGIIRIADIKLGINATKALSFNHEAGILEWKAIEATRTILSDDIYDIYTKSGHIIRCTGNHPFYTKETGYTRADQLKKGQTLVKVDTGSVGGTNLSALCGNIQTHRLRTCEKSQEGSDGSLLQPQMYVHPSKLTENKASRLQGLWSPIPTTKKRWKALLQCQMFWGVHKNFREHSLCAMRRNICKKFCETSILRKNLRSASALNKDDGREQLSLQGWRFLYKRVLRYAENSLGKRRVRLCSLWQARGSNESESQNIATAYKSGDTSYRPQSTEQPISKSDNSVCGLPYNSSQVEDDSISMVCRVRGESIPVYDLQITDNENFFASGILVHNCRTLVLDDLLNPKEAASDTIRTNTLIEMRSTLFSRFNKFAEGRIAMIMQRLHEQDPSGDLLKDGGCYHLKLPAENKGKTISYSRNGSVWTMKSGELLTPRLSRIDLDELMLNLTEYHYVGQYLQDPVPLGGGEFKEAWLQHYHSGAIKPTEMNIVILVDQAGGEELNRKKKKLSDWTVFSVIGLASDNNYYLLDMIRDRLNPTDRVDTLFMLHRKWNQLSGKPPKVGVEQIGMMTDAHYIREKQKQDSYHFSIVEVGGNQIKEERIRWLIPIMQQHRFYIPATLPYVDTQGRKFDLITEMKGEMASFPKARWDDILDTISRLGNVDLCLQFPKVKANMVTRALRKPNEPDNWESW